jgi:hypothetical protein
VGATVPAAVPGAPILGAPSLTRSGTRLIPTFSIVLSAGGPAVTQIQLARGVDGGPFVVFGTFLPTTAGHTDGAVQSGHTYQYRAVAMAGSVASPFSNVISIAVP